MTSKPGLAAIAVALIGALLLALWATGGKPPAGPGSTTPSESPVPAATAESIAPAPNGEEAGDVNERSTVAPPTVPTTGSLLVHVVWGDDRQPAANIPVHLRRPGSDNPFVTTVEHTDDDGEARFADLAPARYWLSADRGDNVASTRAEIVAGQELEATLELPLGMNVTGIVVDTRDNPVPGADVVVAPWAGGEANTLTHTDVDGRFSLRAIYTHSYVGARTAGFAPSLLHLLTGSEGATADLRIVLPGRGGALTGTVFDPQGSPVADAVVRAGAKDENQPVTRADGTRVKPAKAVSTRTDAEGRFTLRGLATGATPVAVIARGLAPWQQNVDVLAGGESEIAVHLLPGVTLSGTVRDASGTPVARAEVRVGDWDDFGVQRMVAGADGSYRVDGLGAGELALFAISEDHGKAEARLTAAPGQELRWDPVLSSGLEFRGRVVSADDEPVAHVMVEAHLLRPPPGVMWFGMDATDDEGRFALKNCKPNLPMRITFRRGMFPELVLEPVVPDDEGLLVKLEDTARVHIDGVVVEPDGSPAENVSLHPAKSDGNGSPVLTTEAGTGAFHLGPYPPGQYSLSIEAPGYPSVRIARRLVEAGTTWNVGTVQLQRGGSLTANLQQPGSDLLPDTTLQILAPDGTYRDRLETGNGTGRSPLLVPGEYLLQVQVPGFACRERPFSIRAGVETQLDVVLTPGVVVELVFDVTGGLAARECVRVIIVDTEARPILRTTAWRARDGQVKRSLALTPGNYRVTASTTTGARGEARLVVSTEAPTEPLRITVR